MLKKLGLLLAVSVWLARLAVDGFWATNAFEVRTLAPSHFNILMSTLSLLAIWLVSYPKKTTQSYLLSLWYVGDLLFYVAPIYGKIVFVIGMIFYGIAHVKFAYSASESLKGRLTLKIASTLGAIIAWSIIMLTGEVSSTVLFTCSFFYAQLVIMFATFSVANAFLKSFGDWSRNTLAGGAILLLAGDLVSSIVLFNNNASHLLGIDRLHFDLVSLLFGSSQLLLVVSTFFLVEEK